MKNSPFIKLKKTKVLRQGILCGEIIKNRFEPHHHFYMSSILKDQFLHKVELDENQVHTYLTGNVVNKDSDKGFIALTYKGHILGFGISYSKTIKNKYPKGLRLLK